jgi:hypothetical protein
MAAQIIVIRNFLLDGLRRFGFKDSLDIPVNGEAS